MNYNIITPEKIPKPSIYLCHADSFLQQKNNLDFHKLLSEIKYSSLMKTSLVLPTSFVLKSDITFNALQDNVTLLEEGIIIPSISKGLKDFESYYNSKKKELNQYGYNKKTHIRMKDKISFLEEHTKLVLNYDNIKMDQYFKEKYNQNILSYINNSKINKAKKILNEIDYYSREFILNQFKWLSKKRYNMLSDYLDITYYFQGGMFNNLDLSVHPNNLKMIRNKIINSMPLNALPFKYDCLKQIINVLNIPENVLLNLTDENIIDLKKDNILKKYTKKIDVIINNIKYNKSDDFTINELSSLQDELKEAINISLKQELSTQYKYQKIRRIFSGFVYATNIVSLMSPQSSTRSIAAVLLAGETLDLIDPIFRRVWEKIGNCEMIFFCQKIYDISKKSKINALWTNL